MRDIGTCRLAEAVNRTLLSHLLKMFTALGIYTESFEKHFLECTSEFYAAEGMKYMQQYDVPEYLKHVEVPRVSSYVSPYDKLPKSLLVDLVSLRLLLMFGAGKVA